MAQPSPRAASASILIAGAGPTGLCLAIWLKTLRPQLALRIVDRAPTHGTTSRAIVIHARTLEFYAQLGLVERIVAAGKVLEGVALAVDGTERAKFKFGLAGGTTTKFPFVLTLPQDVHERVLLERLAELGQQVEWGVELAGLVQTDGKVRATVRAARKDAGQNTGRVGGKEIGEAVGKETEQDNGRGETQERQEQELEVAFVAGCDGAHSAVRKLLGVQMEGDRFATRFYVADTLVGPEKGAAGLTGLRLCLGGETLAAALPLGSEGDSLRLRVLGMVPAEFGHDAPFKAFKHRVEALVGVSFRNVEWYTTYNVYHRVAATYRVNRVFLLGDAAHLHSPVGGQGMNTGLGDAANLAWKLVTALDDVADPGLLDTYEAERRTFAKKLVNTTDRAFHLLIKGGWLGFFLRRVVFAYLIPILWRLPFVPPMFFQVVSQLGLSYRANPLASQENRHGTKGSIHVGDRLPWTGVTGVDNHAALSSLAYEVHRYSEDPSPKSETSELQLPVRSFALPNPSHFGFDSSLDYLVRPDGHIAAIAPRGH